IEVDFDIFEPTPTDFDGILNNVRQVLPHNLSSDDLADLITNYGKFTLLIKQAQEVEKDNENDDAFIFGLVAFLNLNQNYVTLENKGSILESMKKFLIDFENHHKNSIKGNKILFSDIFSSDNISAPKYNIGFLLDERICDIPPQISPQIFENILSELNENPKTYSIDGRLCDYVLCLTRVVQISSDLGEVENDNNYNNDIKTTKTKKHKKLKRMVQRMKKSTEIAWMCPEMEILFEESLIHLDIPVTIKSGTLPTDNLVDAKLLQNDNDIMNIARFFVLPFIKFEKCISHISEIYGGNINP
ncbi:unnamed protein product, partial [Gordionus sp. m RMFG-2023]